MSTIFVSAFGGRVLVCDGKCHKAWGASQRPVRENPNNPDDWVSVPDQDIPGNAPRCPGSSEGGHLKPLTPGAHNKWCARECERSEMLKPPHPPTPGERAFLAYDTEKWTRPFRNIPGGDSA